MLAYALSSYGLARFTLRQVACCFSDPMDCEIEVSSDVRWSPRRIDQGQSFHHQAQRAAKRVGFQNTFPRRIMKGPIGERIQSGNEVNRTVSYFRTAASQFHPIGLKCSLLIAARL